MTVPEPYPEELPEDHGADRSEGRDVDGIPAADGRRPSRRRPEAESRALAAAFGEVLPERTGDEDGRGWGEAASEGAEDAWLRSQVPPHHGD